MKIVFIYFFVMCLLFLNLTVFSCTHSYGDLKRTTTSELDPDIILHVHNVKGQFTPQVSNTKIDAKYYDTWFWMGDYTPTELEMPVNWSNSSLYLDEIRYVVSVPAKECVCAKGHIWIRYYKTEYSQTCTKCNHLKYGFKKSLNGISATSLPPCTQKELGCAE